MCVRVRVCVRVLLVDEMNERLPAGRVPQDGHRRADGVHPLSEPGPDQRAGNGASKLPCAAAPPAGGARS